MRILLASSSFAGGGITSYAHELINCYSEGNDFSVIIGNDEQSPIKKAGVKVYKYDCSDISFSNIRSIIKLINEEICPDVLISSCAKVIALALPYLNDSIKIITVSHSLKYIEADIAAFNYQYSDVVIALSNYNKEYLNKAFNIQDDNKVRVVYNFVNEYYGADGILEKKKQNKDVSIVFPGGAAASKAPEIVVQVLNRLLDTDLRFKFYWLGSTSIHLIRYFPIFPNKDIIDIVKTDDRVLFTGKVPREEAEEIMANADIILSPSRREGCPISLIEAMRVGVIPIVSDYENANREIVREGVNGFVVNHNDINLFVTIIKEVILDKDKYYLVYDKAKETYQKELCYDVWKRKMNELIHRSRVLHRKRDRILNQREYNRSMRKFIRMQKRDNILFLIQEPVPLLLRLQKYKKK